MEKTKVINLFGAPGSGKSTGAAYIFSQLKMKGINCEIVTEYAKDRVWQKDFEVFKNQFYVAAKQSLRMSRLKENVEVIITDSPVAMAGYYSQQVVYYKHYFEVLKAIHAEYENYDCFISRVKAYNPSGRFQTEEQANVMHKEIETYALGINNVLHYYDGDIAGYDRLIKDWLNKYEVVK